MSKTSRRVFGFILFTAVVVATVCVLVLQPTTPIEPATYSVVDIPRMVYRGTVSGRVRVVLRFPLRLSPDRMAGTYSPSVSGDAAITIAFQFREPCPDGVKSVSGTVGEFRVDTFERLNRLPGYATLTDCVANSP